MKLKTIMNIRKKKKIREIKKRIEQDIRRIEPNVRFVDSVEEARSIFEGTKRPTQKQIKKSRKLAAKKGLDPDNFSSFPCPKDNTLMYYTYKDGDGIKVATALVCLKCGLEKLV